MGIRDDSYVASSWPVLSVNDSLYLTPCVGLSLKTVELINYSSQLARQTRHGNKTFFVGVGLKKDNFECEFLEDSKASLIHYSVIFKQIDFFDCRDI